MTDQQMSIIEHLEALRRALMISMLSVMPGAIVGWFIREEIFKVLVRPVTEMHYKLVYITATEAFRTELKIALFAGVAIASPMIAYQIWKFILPALHAHERRYIMFFVPVSVVLFISGVVFGYYSVFLYGVKFLLNFAGEELTPMLSLGSYMSFSLWFLLPFGLIFELPLLILLLVGIGILTPQFLSAKRKWVLVIAFVASAIITPTTDIFTQGVMALAIYLLYEVSIWISYLVGRKDRRMALPGTGGDGIDETDE